MRIITFVLLIMLTFTLTETQATYKEAKPYGGSLIWGTCHKPTIINPVYTTSSVSMSLLDLIFNRLVRINSKGEIEPDLAERWEVSPDGLVYTFYLRKGVRFHDGVECTAYDVEFTYSRMIDLGAGSPYNLCFESVEYIKVIDRYIFQVGLKRPSAPFIYMLAREIIPKHILEDADLRKSAFNTHPIGTGPFRFKEWRKDDTIILTQNPDYYEGRPCLDEVIVKTYADSRGLWNALMRGEVDYATFIEREDYEVVKDDASFRSFALPLDSYYAIYYNLNDPVLSDKRIREAIAYAIDRKTMIERAGYGYGIESNGPFYPGSLGFNPDVKAYEYNPKKAVQLLKEAGWMDNDNDGILEREGEELGLRVLVDSRSEVYKRIIMVIRQQLQEIGIKVRVALYDNVEMLTGEFLSRHKPQVHLKTFLSSGPKYLEEEWSSKFKRPGKLWVYKNEEMDSLFEEGEAAQGKEERQYIYRRIHKLIYDDQPCCFLYFPFVFHAVSAKFEDVDEFFTSSMPYYTMKDWYIRERR